MKAAKNYWMVALLPALLMASCSRMAEDFPTDNPQMQNRMNATVSVLGVEGTYSSLVDDCIPPTGNCFSNSKIAPSQAYYTELESAVINNSIQSFVTTDDGKQFLTGLDSKVAADLLAGNTTIMKFSGRYFAVYPGATGPYDGPNYGTGGAPFKPSEIPN